MKGVVFVDGAHWKEQRGYTIRHLRDLGFGKILIENQVMDEILELIKEMKNTSEFDPQHIIHFHRNLNVSVLNILWAILAGTGFNRIGENFQKLMDQFEKFVRGSDSVAAAIPIPV